MWEGRVEVGREVSLHRGTGGQEELSNLAVFSGTQVFPPKNRSHLIGKKSEPGVLTHNCNPSTWEAMGWSHGMEETVWVAKVQNFIGFALLQGGYVAGRYFSPGFTYMKKLQLLISAVWNYHQA